MNRPWKNMNEEEQIIHKLKTGYNTPNEMIAAKVEQIINEKTEAFLKKMDIHKANMQKVFDNLPKQ